MPDIIQEYNIGEFRGSFPDVPISAGVNLDELKELDANPFYVTLPIVPEVGAISKNGLLYDEALVNSVEKQINDKRPGGIFGHLKDEERNTAYPIPSGMWVGAKRVGQALWAKCYVPPGVTRDHMRTLKAIGGSISTSIYGKGDFEKVKDGVRRLTNFNLESLDFAPPERAALGYGSTLMVTSEFENNEDNNNMTREELLAGLTANDVPASVREQIAQGAQASRVTELTTQLSDRDVLIAELQRTVAEQRVREFDAALDTRIAELINWPIKGDEAKKKLDSFKRTLRSRIIAEFGDKREASRIAEVVATVWAELQPLAETVRDALAGPSAIVASRVRGAPKFEVTQETMNAARALFSF